MSKWRTRTHGSSRQVGKRFKASSSGVRGGTHTKPYAPSNVWGYASYDTVIRDATDPFDPNPKLDNWEVIYKGQRIFSGLTKEEAIRKTHEFKEASRSETPEQRYQRESLEEYKRLKKDEATGFRGDSIPVEVFKRRRLRELSQFTKHKRFAP